LVFYKQHFLLKCNPSRSWLLISVKCIISLQIWRGLASKQLHIILVQ
jgi:hypothetical protein